MDTSEKSQRNMRSIPIENIPVFRGSSRGSPDGGRAWLVAFAIFVVNFLVIGLGRVSGIFFVDYMEVFHVKRKTASTPFSVQQSIRNLFGPVVGILGQMFSVRALTMTGGLMAAVSAFSCAFAPNIIWITIFWGDLYGVATAFTSTINQALINMYFLNNRTSASGLAFAGGSLGAMVFPFFVEILLIKWGVKGTYVTMAVLLLLIIPVAIIMKKPPWLTQKDEEIEWDKLIDTESNSQNELFQGSGHDHLSFDSGISQPYVGKGENSGFLEEADSKFGTARPKGDRIKTSREGVNLSEEVSTKRGGENILSSQRLAGKLFSPVVELLKVMFIEPTEEVPSTIKSDTEERISSSRTSALSLSHIKDQEKMPLLSKAPSKAKPFRDFGKVFSLVVNTLKEMFIEPTEKDVSSEAHQRRGVEEGSYGYEKTATALTGQEEGIVPHEFERKVCIDAPKRVERQVHEEVFQSSHSIPSSTVFSSQPPTFPSLSTSAPPDSPFLFEETFKESGISVKAITPVKIPLPSMNESKRKYSEGKITKSELDKPSLSSRAKRETAKDQGKNLVDQISYLIEKAPSPRIEAEVFDDKTMTKSTFSTVFSKFPSIERGEVDEEIRSYIEPTLVSPFRSTVESRIEAFKSASDLDSKKTRDITSSDPLTIHYGTSNFSIEQDEMKRYNIPPIPAQKIEVVVEKRGDNSHKQNSKQKRINTKRKIKYPKRTDSGIPPVPVKDTFSWPQPSTSGIEVTNRCLGKHKCTNYSPIEINFRFLHENIRYIMHIIRITESLLIESTNPLRFQETDTGNLEFVRALERFFCSLEEAVGPKTSRVENVTNASSGTDSDVVFKKDRFGSDPENGKVIRKNVGESEEKPDLDMSFTNRQIFYLLKVLSCQNEVAIASHFPQQDQENVLKVISELKKLIRHCHSIDYKYSTTKDPKGTDSEARGKSASETTSPNLPTREIEREFYGVSPQQNETMHFSDNSIHVITVVERPPSDNNVDSGNISDTPPLVTLGDQIKVVIRLHTNPLFLLVCLSRVLHFFAFTGVLTIIVDYGVDRGLGMTNSVFLISALSLGDFIGRIFTGWITDMDILNLELFMALALIFQGVLSASFNWAPARYLYVVTAIFSVTQGAVFVRYPVLLCKYTKDYEHSVALGFSNFFSGIIGFGMPSYIGYFRDTLGSYGQIFSINGGVCVIVGILWTFVPCYLRCLPP